MAASRFSLTHFGRNASLALLALTAGAQAAVQQTGADSGQPSAAPNPAVVRELDRLFREGGQEMPSMYRQDLPYAQTPQTNRIRRQPGAPSARSGSGAKKPGLLKRFFSGFRRKKTEQPQPTVVTPPAPQSAPPRMVRRPAAPAAEATRDAGRVSIPFLSAAQSKFAKRPESTNDTAASFAVPPMPADPKNAYRQPVLVTPPDSVRAELRQPMAIQPGQTTAVNVENARPGNAVRVSDGQPGRRLLAPNDDFVSPFDEPVAAEEFADAVAVPDLSTPPAPLPPLQNQASAVEPINQQQSNHSDPTVPPMQEPPAENPFRNVQVDSAQEAFRSVRAAEDVNREPEPAVDTVPRPVNPPMRRIPLGEWRQSGTPFRSISQTKRSPIATQPAEPATQQPAVPSEPIPQATDRGSTAPSETSNSTLKSSEAASTKSRERLRAVIQSRQGTTGFRGFCPVALRDRRELVDADAECTAAFGLQVFGFSSPEARQSFLANPTRYAPAAGGSDVVMLVNSGEEEQGSIEYAAWFRDRLYLFTSRETMTMFLRNSATFADKY